MTVMLGSTATLSSAPLGAPPQLNATVQKAPKLKDGQSIVIGEFASRQDADFQLSSLLDFMDSNSKIVKLELANGFDYAVKEKDGLFVVSIEPFINDDVLNDVLVSVKEQYPKAHAEACIECVREDMLKTIVQQNAEQEQELLENAIALDDSSSRVEVRVEEDGKSEEVVVNKKDADIEEPAFVLPFDKVYLLYGAGGLALLILIFLLVRKPKKSSDKEIREMYAEAQRLEREMSGESEESPEPDSKEASPVVETAEETPTGLHHKAEDTTVDNVAVEQKVEPEPVSKPASKGELNHKLREPNTSIGTITKENFKEFEGLRLLIAEDNLINQKVIVGLLKESGINIKIANDGQECLEILAEDPNYPIVLMDAHMPRIDGLEATRRIRANPMYDHITVMALSGDTGADDIRKMRECGMEEQLEKPLKVAALYQALYCYFDPNAVGGPAEELPEIHLDNSLGLEMLGGDLELYHEILREFQTLYHDSDEKIELWLKHGDNDKAKALLLDVRGIGESIGTAELTQTAEEFREAITANQTERFGQLLNLYRSQLKSILADIAEV